jgi:hypothetical protein
LTVVPTTLPPTPPAIDWSTRPAIPPHINGSCCIDAGFPGRCSSRKTRTFMVNERFQVAKRCKMRLAALPPSDQCRPGRI